MHKGGECSGKTNTMYESLGGRKKNNLRRTSSSLYWSMSGKWEKMLKSLAGTWSEIWTPW